MNFDKDNEWLRKNYPHIDPWLGFLLGFGATAAGLYFWNEDK